MTAFSAIRISEIFGPTIQGEGALIGQPTVFVRTGGCDYRCVWCDTPHAVDSAYREEWTPMKAQEIFERIETLSSRTPLMVTLSGGNPAIQPFGPLIALGQGKGYRFALETQGSIAQDWFSALDILTLSPKPPSSAMETDWSAFDACLKAAGNELEIALKIVVFDETDYAYARDVSVRYPMLPIYLQPGNDFTSETENTDQVSFNARLLWLIERVNKDQWFNVTLLPQLHVMLWGNMRGV